MVPGAKSKFGAPVFETEVFRKQMYCIDESTCDAVDTFRRSHIASETGELCPLAPLVTQLVTMNDLSQSHFYKITFKRLIDKHS